MLVLRVPLQLDGVNAVFVGYLLDLDHGMETFPEIHDVCRSKAPRAPGKQQGSEAQPEGIELQQDDGTPLLAAPSSTLALRSDA